MTYIEAFYASLYYARLKSSKPSSNSVFNFNLILCLCLIMFIGSLLVTIAILAPDFGEAIDDLLKDIFGRKMGRNVGRLIVVFGILIFYPIIRYTVGTDANYNRITERFKALSEDQQKKVDIKGAWFFGITLGSFILPLLIYGIKSLIG